MLERQKHKIRLTTCYPGVRTCGLFLMGILICGCGNDHFAGRGDYAFELAGKYIFVKSMRNNAQIHCKGVQSVGSSVPAIPPEVTHIAWNEKFVIARQVPLGQRDDIANYWILDVDIPELHGPFGKEEFDTMRKRIDVATALSLRKSSWYRGKKGVREL